MRAPWSQDYRCAACKATFNLIVEKAEKDTPQPCPTCQAPSPTIFTAPTFFKAAHVDGHRDEGLRKLAMASEIEAESFNLPPDKRGDHDREIQKLTEIKPT